jgi:hypothetical protein
MSAQENRIRGGMDTDIALPWRAAALELVSTGGVILGISQLEEQRQGYPICQDIPLRQ